MPTRTPRKPRKPAGNTKKQQAQIIWAIAEEGDINENHAGGNATKELQRRLQARGVILTAGDLYNRLHQLDKMDWVTRVTKDHKCYALRLNIDPQLAGDNPYGGNNNYGKFSIKESTYVNGNGHQKDADKTQADYSQMTIRDRLDLAMELLTSVKADLARI